MLVVAAVIERFDGLVELARHTLVLPGLNIVGLMTMAPLELASQPLRILFARTRRLLERVRLVEPLVGNDLSMGMSGDFEMAIEEGATHIRLGRLLFE